MPLYAHYGVAHAWLVDPLAHTLEAYELNDGTWLLLGTFKDDDSIGVAPFAAISFSLAELWT